MVETTPGGVRVDRATSGREWKGGTPTKNWIRPKSPSKFCAFGSMAKALFGAPQFFKEQKQWRPMKRSQVRIPTLYSRSWQSRLAFRRLGGASQHLHTNGSAGRTILLRYRREEAWATLVSFLGLPADPSWADHILGIVEGKKKIEEIDGIGCQPALISATTEEMLEWIGNGLRSRVLSLPERNGPIVWPRFSLSESLFPAPSTAGL